MTAWQPPDRTWQLFEMDLFADLSPTEMAAIASAAPMREVPPGSTVYSPYEPQEVLFIVKRGRVRVYRGGADGRTLTTSLIQPGQIFGEMLPLGQRMADSWAETMEHCVLCLMSRDDVQRLLLADPRISGRIAEHLGRRVADLEQRLSDTVLRPAPARVASALAAMAGAARGVAGTSGDGGRLAQDPRQEPVGPVSLRLSHEQLADLVGTTRETTTKVLGELRDLGVLTLRRGRVVVHDPSALRRLADDDATMSGLRSR